MQLDLERIKEKFYRYSGEDSDDVQRCELCSQLCEECMEWALTLIKQRESDPAAAESEFDEYASSIESWVAAAAFYQLTLSDEATTPKSISADGVQINDGERSAKAKLLAEQKRMAVLPVIGEGAFFFGRA